MNSEKNQKENIEKPEETVEQIINELENIHETLVEEVGKVGYAIDAIKSLKPVIVKLGNASTHDADVVEIYETTFELLRIYRDQVLESGKYVQTIPGIIGSITSSTDSVVSSSGTAAIFMNIPDYSVENLPVFTSPANHNENVSRFTKIDPALGRVYQEIWEILYGTRADPERGALYLIRQAFDHLFGALAPDNEVRTSPYWARKSNEPFDQINREERIQYAAVTHIKDSAKAKTLLTSTEHMLKVYKALNSAHKRGDLNPEKARQALSQMRVILEDWVNAINLE